MNRLSAALLALWIAAPATAAEIRVQRGPDGEVIATNASPGAYAPAPARPIAEPLVEEAVASPPPSLDRMIREVASQTGLSPSLIRAVVAVESAFDPRAVSRKGARGLMQLMPATARAYGVDDVYDPRTNLEGGARHLNDLLRQYGGDLRLALAAYNAGPGAVERHGGIPPYRETRQYVRRVLQRLEREEQAESPAGLFSYRDHGGTLVMSNVPARGLARPVRLAELP